MTTVQQIPFWISVFSCIAALSAGAEAHSAIWSHPAWATPSKPFEGEVQTEIPEGAGVQLRYTIPGGAVEQLPCTPAEGNGGTYAFAIPAAKVAGADEITFWLETSDGDGNPFTTERRTVPRSQVLEVEVSGKTDEDLTYPLDDWQAEILFRPCCLIISGWIYLERIPVLPVATYEGLPDSRLSPFLRVDPDDLVKATGGVNLRIAYEVSDDTKVTSRSIQPWQWRNGEWSPVFDATVDAGTHTVTFPFPNGGLVVIAGNSSE